MMNSEVQESQQFIQLNISWNQKCTIFWHFMFIVLWWACFLITNSSQKPLLYIKQSHPQHSKSHPLICPGSHCEASTATFATSNLEKPHGSSESQVCISGRLKGQVTSWGFYLPTRRIPTSTVWTNNWPEKHNDLSIDAWPQQFINHTMGRICKTSSLSLVSLSECSHV